VVILGLRRADSDVCEWVFDHGLEDVWWLHSNLLREAPLLLCTLPLHVKLVHDELEDVELAEFELGEHLLIATTELVLQHLSLIFRVVFQLSQETAAAIPDLNDFVWISTVTRFWSTLREGFPRGLQARVLWVIDHVRIVDFVGEADILGVN